VKIYFLGTCCGAEPIENRNHASILVECGDKNYFFDAGEGCSRTAHLLGVDLLKVKKIVISHPHMDHVGGLGNLLWNIRKLSRVKKVNPLHGDIEVYIPVLDTFDGVMKILQNSEGGYQNDYETNGIKITDGTLFTDENLKVTAFHNEHLLRNSETGDYRSFSFLIEGDNKRLVYSGDIKSQTELDDIIGDGVDALIVETGHRKILDVYEYSKNKNIGMVYFSHNGREILNAEKEADEKVKELFKGKGIICTDKMVVEL
jgi:ribonuclease BN (tRNA processing enzyme)